MAAAFITKMLECPICFEQICRPKALPCQHTFCLEPCLKDLVSEKTNIECPICRKIHDLPIGGIEKFPNNFTMLELLDESNKMNHDSPRSEHTEKSRNSSPVPTAPPVSINLQIILKDFFTIRTISRKKIKPKFICVLFH